MLSGGTEESTEKTSQSFEGQKVRSHYVRMIMCGCYYYIIREYSKTMAVPCFPASSWTDCYSMRG